MHRNILIVLSSICIVVLAISLTMEFAFHQQACRLCHLQRWPYALVMIGSLYGLYTRQKLILLRILQGLLIASFLIASYHSAIIFGVIDDPCIIKPKAIDLQSFKELMEAPLPCSVSPWKIFQIPISLFNSVLSFILVISIQLALSQRKKANCLLLLAD